MAAKKANNGMTKIKVELRTPSKDQRTAFVGGVVNGRYKGYTMQLKEEVEIPTVLVPNLENAYTMGMGDNGTLEPMPRYVVTKL